MALPLMEKDMVRKEQFLALEKSSSGLVRQEGRRSTTVSELNSRTFRFFAIVFMVLSYQLSGQPREFPGLTPLEGHLTQVYFSTGSDEKAVRIANQMDHVINFYDDKLMFRPEVILLVLSPDDWGRFTNFPVYGMPHYSNNKTLIVASQNNDFWDSFIPPQESLSADIAELVSRAYSGDDGKLTMEPFFDLLAIHELGHAYHIQDNLLMQRKWMGEVFVNLFLHTYIAEHEPQLLPQLTVFPRMVLASTQKSSLKYTTLKDLEDRYNEIGQQYPMNYGWYQCRWHNSAAIIYDVGGIQVVKDLWDVLKSNREPLDDEKFASLLSREVHQKLADVYLKWDEE